MPGCDLIGLKGDGPHAMVTGEPKQRFQDLRHLTLGEQLQATSMEAHVLDDAGVGLGQGDDRLIPMRASLPVSRRGS